MIKNDLRLRWRMSSLVSSSSVWLQAESEVEVWQTQGLTSGAHKRWTCPLAPGLAGCEARGWQGRKGLGNARQSCLRGSGTSLDVRKSVLEGLMSKCVLCEHTQACTRVSFKPSIMTQTPSTLQASKKNFQQLHESANAVI